ncbi:hypothetical protein FKM82_007601 [Ascaphus truei]
MQGWGTEPGWDSDTDSTWEEGEERRPPGRRNPPNRQTYRKSTRAARDMQNYRRGYPDLKNTRSGDESKDLANLRFYLNEVPFKPYGVKIDQLLQEWKDDYYTLEENHSYIQWLFPLREHGMNWDAQPLTLHEIKEMKNNEDTKKRFLMAYELMLGFYGIKLRSKKTGAVIRAENWQDRFYNLNHHSHTITCGSHVY